MRELLNKIQEHSENASKIQKAYLGNCSISFEKGKKLQAQREKEIDKMNFFINLKKEIEKGNKNGK